MQRRELGREGRAFPGCFLRELGLRSFGGTCWNQARQGPQVVRVPAWPPQGCSGGSQGRCPTGHLPHTLRVHSRASRRGHHVTATRPASAQQDAGAEGLPDLQDFPYAPLGPPQGPCGSPRSRCRRRLRPTGGDQDPALGVCENLWAGPSPALPTLNLWFPAPGSCWFQRSAAMNSHLQVFVRRVFSCLTGVYLTEELLGHMAVPCFVVWGTVRSSAALYRASSSC